MKRFICAFLCLTLLLTPFALNAKAADVFASPTVKCTKTEKSKTDIVYSFSLLSEDAVKFEKTRLNAYDELKDTYTDAQLIAAGQSWLLYETVLLIKAEKDGSTAPVCDVSVFDNSFYISLCKDILPALALAGLYEHSEFSYNLSFVIALKYEDEFIEVSPSLSGDALLSPATARIIYNISEKAENPNPQFVFTPYSDLALKNPSLEGYTFAGWETENGFVDFIPGNTEEYTLTARWDARTYKINYVLTTRSGPFIYVDNTGNPKTRVFGEETEIFAVYAPMGYVFGGWYENAYFTGEKVTRIAADRTGDILLFARWLTEDEAENQKLIDEHWGDINGDGNVTTADARLVLRSAVGLETFSSDILARADFEGNGLITTNNARQILRIAVGLDTLKEVLTRYGRI